MASPARTPSVIPTPIPALAPEDNPADGSDDAVASAVAAAVGEAARADVFKFGCPVVDVDIFELLLVEVATRGSAATAVAKTSGESATKVKSSSLQQLVLRPVTDPIVPCGAQQNESSGLKQ